MAAALQGLPGAPRGALLRGSDFRPAKATGDGFVAHILATLPAATAQRCQSAPKSEQELVCEFEGHTRQLVAAALAPPSNGPLSYALGWSFARLYRLQPVGEAWLDARGDVLEGEHASPFDPAGPQTEAEVAKENLAALALAAGLLRCGRLHEAVARLEATLRGQCRELVEPWLAEARHTLLVRQAVRAIWARTLCLHNAVGGVVAVPTG
uniref:Uncharacterized protein n=1 Tax=Alexandrium catenella TaxID=2925 RepID=A0A7S1RQJ6_ALECA